MGLALPMPNARRTQPPGQRRGDRISAWLAQTGVTVSLAQVVSASGGIAALAYVALTVVSGPVVAVVPAIAFGFAPLAYFSKLRRRRLAQAQREWPDVLRELLTGVVSGQTLHQGLMAVGDRGGSPLHNAFARYQGLSRSIGTLAALEIIRADLADPVSDRVIEVLIIASERGGSAVRTILEDLAASITADLRVLDELDTEVLESRINARAVVVLPWVALVMLNQGGGAFRDFYATSAGIVVVGIGAVLTLLGSAIVVRLGRLPVETRVLHSPVRS